MAFSVTYSWTVTKLTTGARFKMKDFASPIEKGVGSTNELDEAVKTVIQAKLEQVISAMALSAVYGITLDAYGTTNNYNITKLDFGIELEDITAGNKYGYSSTEDGAEGAANLMKTIANTAFAGLSTGTTTDLTLTIIPT